MFIKVSDKLIKDAAMNNLSLLIYTLIKGDRSFLRDTFRISINDLVEMCGYKPNRNAGKINDKTIHVLKRLESKCLINCKCDIEKIKPSSTFEIIFNSDNLYEQNIKHFALLKANHFNKIFDLQSNNKAELMRVFLYTKLYMYEQIEGCPISKVTINQLKKIINVSSNNTVAELFKILINNSILYKHSRLDTSNDNFKTIAYYSVVPFTEDMQNICEDL